MWFTIENIESKFVSPLAKNCHGSPKKNAKVDNSILNNLFSFSLFEIVKATFLNEDLLAMVYRKIKHA